MIKLKDKLDSRWLHYLQPEFEKRYMRELVTYLELELNAGKTIHPHMNDVFAALNLTSLNETKVVIIGQDPYHGLNQAHGLSFSVPKGVAPPPSLSNIYKELKTDLNCRIPINGNLLTWAQQGVLLLNSVLTVEHARAGSHQHKGWELFTDRVVSLVNQHTHHCVFLLWGAYAQKKGSSIDKSKHLVLQAPHPSPLSAYRGFFGCRHFSIANEYLQSNGRNTIDWQID